MIGYLPDFLDINGEKWAIRSDSRVALIIFDAFSNNELSENSKIRIMLECLYVDKLDYSNRTKIIEMAKQAKWFLDGGQDYDSHNNSKKLIDWKQDEQMIFSAINKVAGKETRNEIDKIHWWTFLGFFNEINQGLLSEVINIRNKRNNGKKLEKYEQEFYNKNKEIVNIKQQYSKEEKKMIDKLNDLCK